MKEEIEYYRLTLHETGNIVELVTFLINQESEEWARELTRHCLKEGEIWGAFEKNKLIGVGFSFPISHSPLFISAEPISIFSCPVKNEEEVRETLREKLAY